MIHSPSIPQQSVTTRAESQGVVPTLRGPFGTMPSQRFYLAGGTALALRLGHRRSVNLDFFSETDEVTRRTRHEIIRSLIPLGVHVLEDVDGNLLTIVSGMRVGFFSYGYRLLELTLTC